VLYRLLEGPAEIGPLKQQLVTSLHQLRKNQIIGDSDKNNYLIPGTSSFVFCSLLAYLPVPVVFNERDGMGAILWMHYFFSNYSLAWIYMRAPIACYSIK
jgi:hypothetical protein